MTGAHAPAAPRPSDPGAASLRAQRLAQLGLVANVVLAMAKLVAGLVGNSYALVADAIESSTDMLGSAVVWSGLRIARRDPDETYPFGYGRAEALAAATVAVMMLGAAVGIAIEAVREIRTPHHAPAPWTLAVLAGVVAVKELLARLVAREARATGSVVVSADAGHHRADALTSAAAFVGIAVALLGGPGWEPADDWAALVAALVIVWNGVTLLRTAVAELMDRAPDGAVLERVAQAATGTPGVLAIHKLMVRRAGAGMYVDLHVQADPALSLRAAHDLSGAVKGAIRQRVPGVLGVLIHMEPFDGTEDA
jgi:cation diffusion facilitator family transporter